jgi:hypothetical protein
MLTLTEVTRPEASNLEKPWNPISKKLIIKGWKK